MREIYDINKENDIIKKETRIFDTYFKIISKYSSLFKKYNCFLNVSLFWNDFFTGYSSKSRLPFRNGYSCYMCCEVQREGQTVYVKSIDGEVDYYSVEAIWPVSAIERKLLKTEVVFYSNPEDVRNDMEQLFLLLSSESKNKRSDN